MAAAVMRAMTFGLSDGGASSSRSGDDGERRSRPTSRQAGGGGSNSRSSSKTGGALARSLSRGFGGGGGGDHADGSEEGDTIGESLSRTSSRMAPPASILLNPNRPSPLPSPSNSPPNASHLNIPTTSTSLSALSGADLSRSISSPADLAVSPPSSSIAAGGLSASRPTGQLQRQSSDLSTNSSTTSRTSSQQPPITPIHGFFPSAAYSSYQNTPSSSASPSTSKQQQQQQKRESTIRFAPLPEIRPRSYSTGHNVWLEDDPEFDPDSGEPLEGYFEGVGDPAEGGGEGGQGLPRRRFVRRDDVEAGDYALDDEDDHRPSSSSKWGSWTEAFLPTSARRVDDDAVSTTSSNGAPGTSFSGLERTTSGTSSLGGASNYSAGTAGSNGGNGGGSSKKLLKAFGFGKSKKSKKGAGATNGDNDGDLSRTSSVDSSVAHSTSAAGDAATLDRRSSIDGPAPLASPPSLLRPASTQTPLPRPKGSTGIPMRKASTWEAGDSPRNSTTGAPVYYASPARSARKRANYPPVAQRSRNARKAAALVQVEEPAFSEWGSVAGSGSGAVGRGRGGAAGGGRHGAGGRMLAKEAAGGGGGGEEEDDGSGLAWLKKRRAERERREREERERAAAAAAVAAGEEGGAPPSTDAPLAAASIGELSSSSSAPDSSSSSAPSSLAARRTLRSPPTRSGTLDSTTSVSSNATVRPSTPHAPHAPSGLAASRPTLSVDIAPQLVVQVRGESLSPEADGGEEDDEGEDTPATTPMSAVSAEEEESESEDEEEEEGEQDEEDDDDDDLDEEELAREEALAEEAKRGAKAMGAERYHSASHENRLLQVSDA